MKLWAWLIAFALIVAAGAPAEAGKRKGAVSAQVAYGVAKKLKGLSITVEPSTLTIKKGKRKTSVASGLIDGRPWLEVVAYGKLIQVAGGDDGATVTVAPATKLAKKRISAEKAIAIVEAEAARRGIEYDELGAIGGGGVVQVALSRGGQDVVIAVVGARSRDLLRFDQAATPDEVPAETATSDVYEAILAAHNQHRADHCAPALTWSDELAAVAQAWADQLRDAGCAFEHSSTPYGENLAAGTTGSLSPGDVIAMWYDEIADYDFKKGGFSMSTGHFTQVVWKDTTRLGCGVAQCSGMDIWVCNYDPPGNVERGYSKNVLPTSCR
jgi:uncharacterized protein YkwD